MVEIISLDGIWQLINKDRAINITTDVPSSVFETLIEQEIIQDPFYGVNEHSIKWVYESDWYYEKEFEINTDFLAHKNIMIRFKGIDTIGEIYLNDKLIGSSNDMFISYEFDVKSELKVGINILEVIIKSPTLYTRNEMKKHKIELHNRMGLKGIPYLRKAQYSFGWDWGPKIPDIGIWQTVEIYGYDGIKIESIYPIQTFNYNINPNTITNSDEIDMIIVESVYLEVNTELILDIDDSTKNNYKIRIKLETPSGKEVLKEEKIKEHNPIIEFDIEDPILWWTHDLGSPFLYKLTTEIWDDKLIDTHEVNIGLRDIQLICNPDKWGETFYFTLNGVPIFAKGANWIPIDSLISRGKKKSLYEKTLKYTLEANMNFLRVWGGGIYEDDLFYDLCDKYGILIWQDFPFACAIYPIHEEFIELVKEEAIQNIKRIRHHPSLALWCGNNEIEWLFMGYIALHHMLNPKKIDAYKKGYFRIFEKLLPELVHKYDPQHSYWPSSPSNGGGEIKRGLINSNDPNRGDSHFWKVWHQNAPFNAYRKFNSRFMSEYGFESFPSIKTIQTFCPPDQYNFNSPIMENHQKNRAGNKKIMKYMKRRFSIPESFEKQVILSQITQAEAMEYGIEHWRRNRNDFHCMGSLYWQLNDCWPVASWSSLDYFLRWKALHYVVKRSYEPFFASVMEEKDSVEFWLTNDHKNSKSGTLSWRIISADGKILINDSRKTIISPCSSFLVQKMDLKEIEREKKYSQNIIFFTLKDDNDMVINRGFRLFDHPKNYPIKNPEISHKITELERTDQCKIEITTKQIALYVYIESDSLDFIASDNYFSMEPKETRNIILKNIKFADSPNKVNIKEIRDKVYIKSLFDVLK